MGSLRIIFAGTPEFARVALERLHAAGHTISLVLTQPDRPAGRGMKLQASAVKLFALEHGLTVAQPRSLRMDGKYPDDANAARAAIAVAQADVMVVAAYGLILPQWVLDDLATPGKLGCLNIHGSLLPRWRGAAPIHRAIEAGDAQTGVTIMQMDAGLDTGDMLLRQEVPIEPQDTTASLHDKVADMGAGMVVDALARATQGQLQAQPQPQEGVTYAHKIEKNEAAIDWSQPAAVIERKIRAFNPFPGCATLCNGETLKVWSAAGVREIAVTEPGTIIEVSATGIVVAAGSAAVVLSELQRPGAKRMGAAEFVRGFEVQPGMRMESVPVPVPVGADKVGAQKA